MQSITEDLTIPVYGDGKQVREWIGRQMIMHS